MTREPGSRPSPALNLIECPDHRSVPARVFLTYLIVFFPIWTLRATVLIRLDESIESALWRNLFSNAVKFTIWVLPVLITLSIRRMRPLTYLKLTTPVNKRGLFIAVIVTLAWGVSVVAGESILSHRSPGAMLGARLSEWLPKNGFSPRVIRDLANVFVLGLLFGWLMKKTNSLWPAIGAHIANNFLSGLIHG